MAVPRRFVSAGVGAAEREARAWAPWLGSMKPSKWLSVAQLQNLAATVSNAASRQIPKHVPSKEAAGSTSRTAWGLLGQLGLGGASADGILSGGLGELLERFKQSGGDTAESWVGTGPNKPCIGGPT
jgi:uncharacterized protein YidB (DUF937 family)